MIEMMHVLREVVARVAARARDVALALAAAAFVAGAPVMEAHADPAPTLLWQRYPGTVEYDGGTAVATDSVGDIVVGGVTAGSMGKRNEGGYDAFIVKYSADGTVKWRRQPASRRQDYVNGLATDADDNVVVVGDTDGALAGPNLGETDGFIVKYAADGTRLWMHQFGTPGRDSARAVATDAAGNIIVVGSLFGGGTFDALVIKYAPDGKEKWRRTLRSPGVDEATGVATDAAGNIVVVGYAYGELGGAATFDSDPFVAAYTADGTLRWTEQAGTRGDDVATGVAIDAAGRIFVVGAQTPDPTKAVQGYLAAFSDDGTKQWQRRFGYVGYGVAVDSAGDVVITATAPGGDFAASYTPAGAPQWQLLLPTTSVSWAVKPAADATGHLAIAGQIERGAARGDWDGYVAKYVLP